VVRKRPSEVIQYKVRIREDLRQRLERAATKRDVSINYEMTSRLEASFDREELFTLSSVASALEIRWARFGKALHELDKQGDLLRAALALTEKVEVLLAQPNVPGREGIEAAIVDVRKAINLIDNEAMLAVRRMHTTGNDR